jgi:basic membrane protein A and related proteins
LEVRIGGERVLLGGARQRTVLATLVLEANEVVSTERLIDELWGEEPPSTARHTVEVYVSRLRRLLERAGGEAAIETRAPGYRLRVPASAVDLTCAARLVDSARDARERGELVRAAALYREALVRWRGPVLADIPFNGRAAIEVARIEELRLVALEEVHDVELELGRHGALVEALTGLVARHPERGRFRAQLMLALYRSNRQEEALAAYHAGRRELSATQGLEPTRELRDLAARIIRQDPALDAPTPPRAVPAATGGAPRSPGRVRATRRAFLGVLTVGAALSATALAITLTRDGAGDAPGAEAAPTLRAALLLPGGALDVDDFPINPKIAEGLRQAARELGLETTIRDSGPEVDKFPSALELAARQGFDLVLAFGVGMEEAVAPVAARFPGSHFVVLDTAVEGTPLEGLLNVTGVVFAEHEAAYLAGYLAGLVEGGTGPRLNDAKVVSVIGGFRIPPVQRYVAGFSAGVKRALPGVEVVEGYVLTWDAQERCAALANEQIAAGSDIVFPVAGACGFGALEAALLQGVWGVGIDGDLSYLGPHVLVSVIKRFDRATMLAVRWFAQGRLPRGKTVVFDLRTNGVGIDGISPTVPKAIRERVADLSARIRAGTVTVPSSIDEG